MLVLGIVLVVIGAALLVVEAHVVAYGLLGACGVAALVTGVALALGAAGAPTALVVVMALAVALAALAGALLLARAALRASRRRVLTGPQALVGRIGVVRRAPEPRGMVFVDGALWPARPSWLDEDRAPLRAGDPVVVEGIKGLTLTVRRAEDWEEDA